MRKEDLLKYIGSVNDRYIDELFESDMQTMSKKDGYKSWRTLAASLAVIVVGSAAMFFGLGKADIGTTDIDGNITHLPMAANTVVMLDVNPSIRLEVNDRNIVVDVDAVNGDAEKITADISVVGKKYDEAVKVTVDAMEDKGYITDYKNSVLVTVLDDDEERADAVRDTVVSAIEELDKSLEGGFSILSQTMTDDTELRKLADSNRVSTGRILLLEKVCELDTDFTVEKLVKYNIQTINQLLSYIGLPDTLEHIGTTVGVVPEKIRSEINFDELESGELLNFTAAMSDFYTKLGDYYSVSDILNQVGYILNITQGKNENGETVWGVVAETRNHDVGSLGAIFSNTDVKISDWFNHDNVYKVSEFLKGLLKSAA